MSRASLAPHEHVAEQFERELRRVIARNVQRIRHERGLSLEELDAAAGVHWRHIQKVEVDGVNITLRTLCRLAAGLGVTPLDLLGAGPTPGRRR